MSQMQDWMQWQPTTEKNRLGFLVLTPARIVVGHRRPRDDGRRAHALGRGHRARPRRLRAHHLLGPRRRGRRRDAHPVRGRHRVPRPAPHARLLARAARARDPVRPARAGHGQPRDRLPRGDAGDRRVGEPRRAGVDVARVRPRGAGHRDHGRRPRRAPARAHPLAARERRPRRPDDGVEAGRRRVDRRAGGHPRRRRARDPAGGVADAGAASSGSSRWGRCSAGCSARTPARGSCASLADEVSRRRSR